MPNRTDASPRTEPTPGRATEVRRRLQPTLRGRLGLALLHLAAGAAWLTADDTARLAAAMIAAPVLVDLAVKLLAAPTLAVCARSRRTQARAPFLDTVELANLGRRTLRDLELREPRTHSRRAGPAQLPSLPAHGITAVRIAARSPQRGIRDRRRFEVSTDWPLGFFRWQVVLEVPARTVTEPARSASRALRADRPLDAPPMPSPGRQDQSDDFYSLREYRYGDDARLVHARRSASLGQLVRMTFRGIPEPECALVVDLRRPPGRPLLDGMASFERHLSRAATWCDELLGRGGRFRAVVIDDELHAWAIDSPATAIGFFDSLASARPVVHRALSSAEQADLPDLGPCIWFAAGGHEERDLHQDGQPVRWITEDAS